MTSGRFLLFLVVLAAGLGRAHAAPLDAETCAKLQSEEDQLEHAGAEQTLARGPEWAKANLAPDKLAQMRRYMEVEEQLLFRCRNKALIHLPPDTETAAIADDKEDDNDAAPKAATGPAAAKSKAAPAKQKTEAAKKKTAQPAPKPAAAPPRKPEAAPQVRAPARAAARQPSEPGVTAIEKTPPKAKVDDAYRPPQSDSGSNPFADQLKLPAAE